MSLWEPPGGGGGSSCANTLCDDPIVLGGGRLLSNADDWNGAYVLDTAQPVASTDKLFVLRNNGQDVARVLGDGTVNAARYKADVDEQNSFLLEAFQFYVGDSGIRTDMLAAFYNGSAYGTPEFAVDGFGGIQHNGRIVSLVHDSATANGFVFDTVDSLETSGARLLSVRNQSAEKMAITHDGELRLQDKTRNRQFRIFASNNRLRLSTNNNTGILIRGRGRSEIRSLNDDFLISTNVANGVITLDARGGSIVLANLPTSDPLVAGAIWNNNGVLTIATGAQ